jgi:hypothetical protein
MRRMEQGKKRGHFAHTGRRGTLYIAKKTGYYKNLMKNKINVCLCLMGLFGAIIFSNCAIIRQNDFSQFNFSLKNTLSIFLLNNEKDYYFCIPVQYIGGYQIGRFEFDNGNILIGDYDIFIEKYLTDNEKKNIINEYEKRNVRSRMSIWYDITVDNEEQNGSGLLDDFELHSGSDGSVNEYIWLLPHFELFRTKYLQKN